MARHMLDNMKFSGILSSFHILSDPCDLASTHFHQQRKFHLSISSSAWKFLLKLIETRPFPRKHWAKSFSASLASIYRGNFDDIF